MVRRLSLAGIVLWVLSGVVAGAGQTATGGGLLTSFLVVEAIGLTLVIAIALALRSHHGPARTAGVAAAGLVGLLALATAVGMTAELAGGRAPSWLPIDLVFTFAMAGLYLALATSAWRQGVDRGGL